MEFDAAHPAGRWRGRLAAVPAGLFVLAVPVFLICAAVSWAFNNPALYSGGFEKYRIVQRSGISEGGLEQVAAELRAYFNSTAEPLQIHARIFGEVRPLFNAREVAHMRDVKRLVWWVYLAAAVSGLWLLVFAGWKLARQWRQHSGGGDDAAAPQAPPGGEYGDRDTGIQSAPGTVGNENAGPQSAPGAVWDENAGTQSGGGNGDAGTPLSPGGVAAPRRRPRSPGDELAWLLLLGGGLTALLLAAFGLLALAGFDTLFLRFHELAFSNDFWRLDPRRDYLVLLFPQNFWFDATIWFSLRALAGGLLLAASGGGWLAWRRWGR